MSRLLPLLVLLVAPAPAVAADASLGVGLAASADLPDRASTLDDGTRTTRFGVGPSLQVPFLLQLAPHARLETSGRLDLGVGQDRVTWKRDINGTETWFYDDDHLAVLTAGALTVGAQALLPGDLPVTPYLGAGAGVAWVGTFHSLDADAVEIMDPEVNDLDDPSNIDPYTSQLAFLSGLDLGVERALGDTTDLWIEAGYSVAFVGRRPLARSTPGLDAHREPYGWNALRIGAGVVFDL